MSYTKWILFINNHDYYCDNWIHWAWAQMYNEFKIVIIQCEIKWPGELRFWIFIRCNWMISIKYSVYDLNIAERAHVSNFHFMTSIKCEFRLLCVHNILTYKTRKFALLLLVMFVGKLEVDMRNKITEKMVEIFHRVSCLIFTVSFQFATSHEKWFRSFE